MAGARAAHIDEFERAAAKIPDHAVGAMHAGNHAERGELGLASTGQNLDSSVDGAFGELDERRTVLGIANRRRGDGKNFLDLHGLAQSAKALERGERVLNRVGGEQSRRLHFPAEAAQRLFVEQFSRASRQPFIDDKPDRIRTDVDDRNRRPVVEPSLCVRTGIGSGARHKFNESKLFAATALHDRRGPLNKRPGLPIGPGGRNLRDSPRLHMRSGRCRRRGIESLGDLPRPDRLGLVMK